MKKRTYRTSEQWAELFNTYEQSGLTIAEYCQENKLSQSYFIVKYRQHTQVSLEDSNEPGFVKALPPTLPMIPIKSANNLVLNYNGAQLQLPIAVEPVWLAQLLKALSA